MDKQSIIDALRAFVRQRPGFEFANYGDVASYRADSRKATKDRDIALLLLRDIELRDSITANDILSEARCGRLTIEPRGADGYRIGYCTGQYWCVEYRAAVARLCANVLWTWKREKAMPPARTDAQGLETYPEARRANGSTPHVSAGDWLRNSFRREYGAGIAGRFFS